MLRYESIVNVRDKPERMKSPFVPMCSLRSSIKFIKSNHEDQRTVDEFQVDEIKVHKSLSKFVVRF